MSEFPPPTPATKLPTDTQQFSRFPRWSGILVILIGTLVITSWYAHWRRILQLIPETAPMQYNTALCFILLGTGLFFLTTPKKSTARWLGGATGLLAGLTLCEYFFGKDLGIDLIFYKPYFEAATSFPGRMSPLAGGCFICLSAGLILAGAKKTWSRGLAITGLLACTVAVISWMALCGYVFGIETAYDWGAYSRMAVNTASLLFLYSSGLLVWAWQAARQQSFSFERWLPATASATLIAMVAFVVTINTAALNRSIYWRQHTLQVILSSQAFLDNTLDLQRGLRGYVTLGDTNALAAYHAGENLGPGALAQLTALTHDNAAQQERLEKLGTALQDLLAYDEHLIAIYNDEGFAGISKLDATGQGRMVFGQVRDLLKSFSQEEQKLLSVRDASETANHQKSTRLLVFGCGLAAALLLAGNVMASREMRRRRQAEAGLTSALALQNAILSSASYAIVAVDRHGVVTVFNPAAEKMLGYGAEEIVGKATPQLWSKIKTPAAIPRQIGMERWLAIAGLNGLGESETTFISKAGENVPVLISTTALADFRGNVTGFLTVIGDIRERKLRETEREKLIGELKEALAQVKTLSGLIPICAWCKNIRSDKGYWQTVEQYVHSHTEATFTHGICPECSEKVLAEKPAA